MARVRSQITEEDDQEDKMTREGWNRAYERHNSNKFNRSIVSLQLQSNNKRHVMTAWIQIRRDIRSEALQILTGSSCKSDWKESVVIGEVACYIWVCGSAGE